MAITTDTLIFELKVKDDASKVFDAWTKRLKDLEKDFKETFERIEDTIGKVDFSSLFDKVPTGGVRSFLGSVGNSLTSGFTSILTGLGSLIASTFKSIFSAAAQVVSASIDKIVDVTKKAINVYGEFEAGMKNIAKTSGATEEELDALGESFRKAVIIDLKGTKTVEELQAIAAMSAKFGVAKQDLDTFSISIAKMAEMWDLSVEKTGESAAKLISQYKLVPAQLLNVGSAVDAVADSFATSESFLLRFSQLMSGTAKATGQSLSDVLAMGARITTEAGMAAEAGSTAYSAVLLKMLNDTEAFAVKFGGTTEQWRQLITTNGAEAFNVLLEKLQLLKETQGPQAVTQALQELGLTGSEVTKLMLGLIDAADGNREAMIAASQAFEEGTRITDNFKLTLEGLEPGFAQVDAVAQEFYRTIGEALAPAVSMLQRIFSEELIPVFMEWRDWILQSEEAMLFFETTLPSIVRDAGDAFMALVERVKEFVQSVDWEDVLTRAGTALEHVVGLVSEFLQTLLSDGQSGEAFFSQTLPDAIDTTISIIKTVIDVVASLGAGIKELSPLVELFGKAWTIAKVAIEAIKKAAQPTFDFIVQEIDALSQMLEEDFVEGFKAAISGLTDLLLSLFSTAGVGAADALKAPITEVTSWAIDAIAGIGAKIASIWDKIRSAVSSAEDAVEGVTEKTKAAEKATEDFGETAYGDSVYPDMTKYIAQTEQAQQLLSQSVGDTTGQVKHLGVEAYGNSTYPEMLKYIDGTALNSKLLNAIIRDTTKSVKTLGTASQHAQAQAQRAASIQTASLRAPAQTSQTQRSQTQANDRSGGGGGLGGVTVNNNFVGQNILDESSKDRFTRQIITQTKTITRRQVTT